MLGCNGLLELAMTPDLTIGRLTNCQTDVD